MRSLAPFPLLLIAGTAVAAEPAVRAGDVLADVAGLSTGDLLTRLAAAHGILVQGPLPRVPAPAGLQGDLVEVLKRLLRGTSHAIICADGRPSRIVILGLPQEVQQISTAPLPVAPRWTPRDD